MRDKFSKMLSLLTDELYSANELFDGYASIYNKQATDLTILNMTPGFFQLTMYAYLNMSAMILARLYDADTDTISLLKVRNYLEQNGKAMGLDRITVSNAVVDIDRYLKDRKETIAKLKELRNKALAHNAGKSLNSNIWEEAGLTVGDYRRLINSAQETICILGNLFDKPTPLLGMGIETEIDTIIAGLRKWAAYH